MDMDELRAELEHQKRLRKQYKRNLQELELQEAQHMIDRPMQIINAIEECKKRIDEINRRIEHVEHDIDKLQYLSRDSRRDQEERISLDARISDINPSISQAIPGGTSYSIGESASSATNNQGISSVIRENVYQKINLDALKQNLKQTAAKYLYNPKTQTIIKNIIILMPLFFLGGFSVIIFAYIGWFTGDIIGIPYRDKDYLGWFTGFIVLIIFIKSFLLRIRRKLLRVYESLFKNEISSLVALLVVVFSVGLYLRDEMEYALFALFGVTIGPFLGMYIYKLVNDRKSKGKN